MKMFNSLHMTKYFNLNVINVLQALAKWVNSPCARSIPHFAHNDHNIDHIIGSKGNIFKRTKSATRFSLW